MVRLNRILISLIAIIFLMLMNIGSSIANQVYAWGTWTNSPQWNAPTWDNPPEWNNQHQWTTPPEWQSSPEWKDPSWNTPSEWTNQSWQTPPVWNLNPQSPNGSIIPSQNSPGDLNNPSISPDGPIETNPGLPYNPDYQNPAFDTLDQLDQIKTPSDESFFTTDETKKYDAIKYISKDVVGGTVNFADKIVRADTATFNDYLKYKNGLLGAGFKTFVKGDPTIDAITDTSDFVKNSKQLYDNAKTYNQVKNIKKLTDAGDIITAAEQMDDLYKAGKTFTPANAIVSAVTLPFAIKDTVDNVGKFNSATTSEEKTNAVWDLVGNGGEIITGVAPAVAMIPGAQPIAAGMVVVGGVLSLASLGHKIYRNREKIVKDVKKKFNKAKDAVTGFFKSVFG